LKEQTFEKAKKLMLVTNPEINFLRIVCKEKYENILRIVAKDKKTKHGNCFCVELKQYFLSTK
jgi:hypothetical protein